MTDFTHYRVNRDHQVAEISAQGGTTAVDDPVQQLTANMQIAVTKLNEECIEFDLIGVDAAIANALRRILLAEVPTVAVETVWIAVNTSIIQDEVLAHRIGLIPLRIDPSKLDDVVDGEETDRDTIVLHYAVECTYETPSEGSSSSNSNRMVNDVAYSSSLTWMPQGNQSDVFPDSIRPVHEDIVLAKLRPGQRIEFEAHCRRGIGKDHTKYSPVATASYRLLPVIEFMEPITGQSAAELESMCPMKVFDIEDMGGVPTVKVARPRNCTLCRECIRKDGWNEKVKLRRKADHFLFSVESSGCIPPVDIIKEAISILREKARKFGQLVEEYGM